METQTLADLLEKVRYEFAFGPLEDVFLTQGSRYLGRDDALKQLGDLGILDGSILACGPQECPVQEVVEQERVQSTAFGVTISDLSGSQVHLTDLSSTMLLSDLVRSVDRAMLLSDRTVQLALGTRSFACERPNKTLGDLGLYQGCQLTALKRPRTTCPRCFAGHTVTHDVTIGATHEGWGKRWNTCQYACACCDVEILAGEHVAVCRGCRCFWHALCPAR